MDLYLSWTWWSKSLLSDSPAIMEKSFKKCNFYGHETMCMTLLCNMLECSKDFFPRVWSCYLSARSLVILYKKLHTERNTLLYELCHIVYCKIYNIKSYTLSCLYKYYDCFVSNRKKWWTGYQVYRKLSLTYNC